MEIINADCLQCVELFEDKSIDLIVTSPPYAQQRNKHYGGIPEDEYPQWTANWCNAYKDKLKDHGSIAIVIRTNICQGWISNYVLKTRLMLHDNGWGEPEELLWIKPDSPPMGHIVRPRRSWENILWFSRSNKPFCDPKSNGTPSNRIGLESKKGIGSYIASGSKAKTGIARCKDYVEVGTGQVDKSPENTHPAQYPEKLALWIIKLLCPRNGFVLDPFVGSGSTLAACEELNQVEKYGLRYAGIDMKEEFCKIATARLNKKLKV